MQSIRVGSLCPKSPHRSIRIGIGMGMGMGMGRSRYLTVATSDTYP